MICWDGNQKTAYRYIYGSLVVMMRNVTAARQTYIRLVQVLRYTKKESIVCSLEELNIEVLDTLNKGSAAFITVNYKGEISASPAYIKHRGLQNLITEWNNELKGKDSGN